MVKKKPVGKEQGSMSEQEKYEILKERFGAWENLSEEEQQSLVKNSYFVTCNAGDTVHRGERECKGLIFVKSGMLRAYMMSDEGKEVPLYRMDEGEWCILSASCVISNITFDVHIDAERPTELLVISAPYFRRLALSNIYVECLAYKMATDGFSEVMWAMQQMLFMSFDKRLAVFLWDEAVSTGTDTIKMTHEQVAKHTGSAREVVTRMLKSFAGNGIVELSRGGIKIIDKEKLRKLTE